MDDPFHACEIAVRRADPDRYFASLFAPADRRPFLFAIYALNHELACIGERVRDPAMGAIRLQWWREAMAAARARRPGAHHVPRALAATFTAIPLPVDLFEAMIHARALDLADAPVPDPAERDAYLDATSANLMRLAARVLGADERLDGLAHEAGLAYGLAGLLRNHAAGDRRFLSADLVRSANTDAARHWQAARNVRADGWIAAVLPAAVVPLQLRHPEREVPIWRSQIAFFASAMRGHL